MGEGQRPRPRNAVSCAIFALEPDVYNTVGPPSTPPRKIVSLTWNTKTAVVPSHLTRGLGSRLAIERSASSFTRMSRRVGRLHVYIILYTIGSLTVPYTLYGLAPNFHKKIRTTHISFHMQRSTDNDKCTLSFIECVKSRIGEPTFLYFIIVYNLISVIKTSAVLQY